MKPWLNLKLVMLFLITFGIMTGVRQWLEIKKWEDNITVWPSPIANPTGIPAPTLGPIRSVLMEVPFTSQAPNGEWSDPRHQDGCEEAASLMAVAAVAGGSRFEMVGSMLEKEYAAEEIEKIWAWEMATYGVARDTSAIDTADRIVGRYFWYKNYEVKDSATKEEMIRELINGNLIIVPTNGQLLHNPNFTGLGPERHMVVVKGYDLTKKEFITNDPGTRKGESYRYGEDVLFGAVADYPTGNHVPALTREKRMIILKD